ncbi:CotH kinase family protein [Siphonobacter sp.]|uniref:CotH kinase family protein n=1 Tax=Siphonobacter sp. TaxID=1869184 RepID=UPI003B3B47CE
MKKTLPAVWAFIGLAFSLFLVSKTLSAQVNFTSSNLPILVIDTKDGQGIPDEPKIPATMKIIYRGPGLRNALTDTQYDYNGSIGIEVRGANSQAAPKKSFGFETQEADGSEKDVSLMGMPAEHDWILYASAYDNSFITNVLGYKLSNQIGRYASRSQYVEVVLNGSYHGLYVLGENVKRGKDRIPISSLKDDDVSGDKLTGGYILKVDAPDGNHRWGSAFGAECRNDGRAIFEIHYPKTKNLQTVQRDYIQNYVTQFENLLHAKNFNPQTGYASIADVPSFADYFLMTELSKNSDGYTKSTYFYKDRDSKGGKLNMGPMWDLDLAYGRGFCDGNVPQGWAFEMNLGCTPSDQIMPFWWSYLMQDTLFVQTSQRRWTNIRQGAFATARVMSMIDSLQNIFQEAHARNAIRWNMGQNLNAEIQDRKNFITARFNWMDQNINGLGYYIKPYNVTELCPGNPVVLQGNSSFNVIHFWKQSNGSIVWQGKEFSPSTAGYYMLEFSHASGSRMCTYTFTKTLSPRNDGGNTSRQSGPWEEDNTWSCGKPPVPLQKAYIISPHVVRLNSTAAASQIDVAKESRLIFLPNARFNAP